MPRVRYNKIPLRKRDGSLVAYTLLDPEDYARFNDRKWSLQATGYAQGWDRVARKVRTLHRVILDLAVGDPRHADHINGNRLDNRRENLRAGPSALNVRNYHRPQKNNSTGVLYVSRNNGSYTVRVGGKYYGTFPTLEAASELAASLTVQRAIEVAADYAEFR